jgi:hypothetical protein
MTVQVKPGARFRSAVCGVEVIVVKAPAGELDLRCGGEPMEPADAPRPEGSEPAAEGEAVTLVGKRYTDEAGQIELLVTKSGPSALSIGDTPLEVKGAKPLPASD